MRAARTLSIAAAALTIAMLPASMALAVSPQSSYLDGGSVPSDVMTFTAPQSIPLPNHDPGRNGDPGLTLLSSTSGAAETDPARYQAWALDASGMTLSVNGLRIWAAPKDFDQAKSGRFAAYLMDCAQTCQILDSAYAKVRSTNWKLVNVPLAMSSTTFASGHELIVKIVVLEDSDDAVWFAYGTASFDANLRVSVIATTSTTTSTAPTTTSTSMPGPTTTSLGPVTTTGPPGNPPTTGHGVVTPPTHPVGPDTTTPKGAPDKANKPDQTGTIERAVATTSSTPSEPGTTETAVPEPADLSSSPTTEGPRRSGSDQAPSAMDAFTTAHQLEPAEGLAVAFSTVTENISLYWQAAVGTGGVASILLWVGLSRRSEDFELDEELEP